jgi:glutaredoxin
MEFPAPVQDEFTIYSKSGCINCTKVKKLLNEKNILFTIIDCDEYILESKEEFLAFIKSMTGIEHKIFPIVFDNKKCIGGYNETNKYLEKMLDFDSSFF